MYPEGKLIWYKLSEASKANILGNSKTPHNRFTHINFHCVTLGDIIKASSHCFYFSYTNNDPFVIYPTFKDNYTSFSGNYAMVLNNISKMEKLSPEYIRKLPL